MKPLTIDQVAQRAGVGIETVRFYERKGLLNRPARSPSSGYRLYEEEVIARLRFILRAKQLGFTLNEIKELLALRVDAGTLCADAKARAEGKIVAIAEKIRTLQRMRTALVRLTRACGKIGGGAECPILDALDGHPRSTRKKVHRR